MGGWYGYRASKSALNMVIKSASIEYRRRTKHTALASYHPGTVDTGLSKPFQGNVKSNKLFEPAFTAERLVNILANVDVNDGPYYLDWDNKPITW
jgi:NAD(P)-dependent dehydrogenase (short-subunit alcohol dehydrogenase family)